MPALPLVIFDTNILMELLLGRDGANAVLLVELAERKQIELVVPEYVLFEFRGTALRWIRDELVRVSEFRRAANEWTRSQELDGPAQEVKNATADVEAKLTSLQAEIETVMERIRSVARVEPHTIDLHFRGEIRHLQGRPPDRPVYGLKDCRIYEAVLAIANAEIAVHRPKFLLTRDSDFDMHELVGELAALGFTLRKDPGGLYGQLRG